MHTGHCAGKLLLALGCVSEVKKKVPQKEKPHYVAF